MPATCDAVGATRGPSLLPKPPGHYSPARDGRAGNDPAVMAGTIFFNDPRHSETEPADLMTTARPTDVPPDWQLLPPGDAALTRRVKAAGPHRLITRKKGRRTISCGVWAPAETIARLRTELQAERSTPAWQKKQESAARRREVKQAEYVDDFLAAVLQYLDFHPDYSETAQQLALAVTQHATPVGSGTVARTQRIPLQRRAQAAVIAWMRHQTTGYDQMVIPRQRGKRREVRERLARRSRELLSRYRKGLPPEDECPLHAAIRRLSLEQDGD